jgi:hypothetical protein
MKLQLQGGEQVIRVFHHHYYFFIVRGLKLWSASIPFFFLAFLITYSLSFNIQFYAYLSIVVLFGLVHLYDHMIYYLDSLVITNKRIVHLDWVNLFKYLENQATLDEIQNISTEENGFLSRLNLFDFGMFVLETSSTKTIITFPEAPDPEGIKYFIYNLLKQHHDLENKNIELIEKNSELAGQNCALVDENIKQLIRKNESQPSKVEK